MEEKLVVNGQNYISARRAAEISGYALDYVGQLCRAGKVTGKKVGRNWFVGEESIKKHVAAFQETAMSKAENALVTPLVTIIRTKGDKIAGGITKHRRFTPLKISFSRKSTIFRAAPVAVLIFLTATSLASTSPSYVARAQATAFSSWNALSVDLPEISNELKSAAINIFYDGQQLVGDVGANILGMFEDIFDNKSTEINTNLKADYGVEIKDRETGEMYCLTISHGNLEKEKGTCREVESNNSAADKNRRDGEPTGT